MKINKHNTCRMCNSKNLSLALDLGDHPLVNSLIPEADLGSADPVYPIKIYRCDDCSLMQIKDVVDADEIYKKVDYLYFSSDMPGLSQYFGSYAQELKDSLIKKGDFVVEIGCNDGVMLEHFKSDYKILGVDPSTNVVIRALKKGLPVLPLFFSSRLARQIKKEWGSAKLIVANNCIAHLDDLRDLMDGISALIDDEGIFVLECNYWGGMVKNTNYSLIYHDHYSYFSLDTWVKFAPNYGLQVFDALVSPAQGGSLRVFLSKNQRPVTARATRLLDEERETKLNTMETSLKYAQNVASRSQEIKDLIQSIKKSGKTIAGYGAAAKGMTILKCSGIGKNEIDYFVDDSPAKQGWYTPSDHIPIISRNDANNKLPDYFFILAPNYSEVIIQKEAEYIKKGGKFILAKDVVSVYPE
jgi:SAM-dependent methyltransferase